MNLRHKNRVFVLLLLLLFAFLPSCNKKRPTERIEFVIDEDYVTPMVQYHNANQMLESTKVWRKKNQDAFFTEHIVDSLAQSSIIQDYDYHLPSEKKYFIHYVNDSFFEVLFLAERTGKSVVNPYYLVTADSVYGLSTW